MARVWEGVGEWVGWWGGWKRDLKGKGSKKDGGAG